MRVHLLSPFPLDLPGGNVSTVLRWKESLTSRGHVVTAGTELIESDATILYHARRTGAHVSEARRRGAVLVALGGTDLDLDLQDPVRRDIVEAALVNADLVLAVTDEQRARVERAVPGTRGRVRIIPKAVRIAPVAARMSSGTTVVLPAGLRPVKDPLFAVAPLEKLRAEGVDVKLVVLGPAIDDEVTRAFDELAATRPWLSRRVVARHEVAAELAAADLVINTSRSEGFSNALAEALVLGRVVVASDVPGNRAALDGGRGGLLYRIGDPDDFLARVKEALAGRERLETAARESAKRLDPSREAEALDRALDEARALALRRMA